ncbi:MAG: M20/M25/M40 family metallo-hydrolase [Clostridia bacterium]|nr:M20/M25/M40 family metallo-hydrolase [Clostridia bacterium]
MYQSLKELIKVHGVSGREGAVAKVITDMITPYVDEVFTDALGNLIALKKGNGKDKKKHMLCAHMDEIGFIVTYIEDNGFLRVSNIGGIRFIPSAYAPVVFENGLCGVIAPNEELEKKEDYKATNFYIDIGAKDKKDAEKRVKIGDCAVIESSITRLAGKRIAARPIDDRIGCVILLDIAKKLGDIADDVYFVFSVQEEVGCRGAKTAAFAIKPDDALVFDVTGTGDAPGAKPMAVRLGDGAAIKVKDSSVICDVEMVQKLQSLAKEKRISYQMEILTYGGTDTSSIQMSGLGARVGALSIPTRNIHTATEIIDMHDAEACRDLALAYLLAE